MVPDASVVAAKEQAASTQERAAFIKTDLLVFRMKKILMQ